MSAVLLEGDEMERFRRDGFLGPYRACSVEDAREYRERIGREVLSCDGLDVRSRYQSRHLDSPLVLEVCSLPAIVDRVRTLLGAPFVLWRSNFFAKLPGEEALEWHCDCGHWGNLLDPMINVTAWIALDETTRQNGCVEFVSRAECTQLDLAYSQRFIVLDEACAARSVAMLLQPGEFFLFDERAIHRSGVNTTHHSRLGIAARFTLPQVHIRPDRLFPGHRTIPFT